MPRLIAHIGSEKTGTTAIQGALASSREALLADGILFPASLGERNHIALTAYALADENPVHEARIVTGALLDRDLAAFRADLRDDLYREVDEHGPHTVVVSNEHLSSELRSHEELQRLRDLFDGFGDVGIVLYLRNPIEFLSSWYATCVSGGYVDRLSSPLPEWIMEKVDYRAMIDRWASVFGEDRLTILSYETGLDRAGSIVGDFSRVIGFDGGLDDLPGENRSLSERAVAFLREFNRFVPRIEGDRMNPLRGDIVERLQAVGGPRYIVAEDIQHDVFAAFGPDYSFIERAYLPEAANLTSFVRPPLSSSCERSREATERDFAELFASIWIETHEHRQTL